MIPLYFPPINNLGNISFRKLLLKYNTDFVFTEMIRAEKILEMEEHQLKKLKINNDAINKTFVQIIAEDIENILSAIDRIMKINPKILEINYNMGCPQSSLCKKECGAAITANSKKVKEVAMKLKCACDKYNIVPSIKIRLGISRDNITIYKNVEVIKLAGIKKIYIHGRVLNDTYNLPASYDEIKKVKKLNHDLEIIANGDVVDLDSLDKIIDTNCDGVLIGRAALCDPEIFQKLKSGNYQLNKSGIELITKKKVLLDFINFAKEDNISMSHIKANINYITKNTILSSDFRRNINDAKTILDIENIIKFIV